MNKSDTVDLKKSDILFSSLYKSFLIAFVLMAIVPLLVLGYFVTSYIIPAFQTVENIPLIATLTVVVALIGFYNMRKVLLSFLKLKKYASAIARGDLISISERSDDSDLDDIITSFNSITHRLMDNQKSLKHQNEMLQHRYEEIQRLGGIKEELVGMIAHDVKNFIIIIAANIEMLATGRFDTDPQKKRKYLMQLDYSVESLKRMIDNMLHIDRMELGETRLHLEELDLEGLSLECLQTLRPIFESERKRLVHQVKGSTKPVHADRALLSRVISNLLWNAEQHTSEGGCISLNIGSEADGRMTFLSVSDDGEGIPESIRNRIFEKFFQGDTAKGKKGTAGLGLAFCKIAVGLHGGTIDVESMEGIGSTFTIRLPAADSGAPYLTS